MDNTYIKLWRSIVDSWVFADPMYLKLWIYILCQARFGPFHHSHALPKGGTVHAELQPGQCIFGSRKWADRLGTSKSRVDRMVRELESRGMVGRLPGRHFTVLTVCKWDTYQTTQCDAGTPAGTPAGRQRDASGTVYKKDKKDKKDKYSDPIFAQWWDAYGKKTGKHTCWKLWLRMSAADRQACLEATPAYVQSRPDAQYRKDPERYLKHRLWEDELDQTSADRQSAGHQAAPVDYHDPTVAEAMAVMGWGDDD